MAHEAHIKNGLQLDFLPSTGGVSDSFLAFDSTGVVVQYSSIAVNRLAAQTASVVATFNSSGFLAPSGVTVTELSYLSGATSDIQAQLDAKQPTISLTANKSVISNGSGALTTATTSATEIGYVAGVTSAIQTQLNTKQATITGAATTIVSSNLTANVALISNGSGKVAVSAVTSTELGYVSGVTSAIQTQLDTKLSVTLTSPASGDVITYNGSAWVNSPTGSGTLPTGGTTDQILYKVSNTNYDAGWKTLTLADISDVTATAAEVNILSGVTTTTTELNYLSGVTSSVQSQLNSKLSTALAYNSLFVGNISNVATQLAPGTSGYVLTSVGGVPTWQPAPGGGGGIAGPGTSTDNAIVRWDGILGTTVQDSSVLVDDTGVITGATWNGNVIELAYGGTDADLSGTGGAGQYLKQVSSGAAITVGTIPASDIASGATLTRTNDTNVTLTLGGTPTSALLVATSLTLGWTGTLGVARGGTNLASYTTGDLVYASGATTIAKRAIGSTGDVLTVSGGVPVWAAPSFSGTVTTVSVVTNQGVSGVVANPTTTPAITLSLGALTGVTSFNGLIVTANTGVVTTGTWNGTIVGLAYGGTNTDLSAGGATGDLIQGASSSAFSRLASVAAGGILLSGGVATLSAWGSVGNGLTSTASTLKLGGTLTGATSLTSNNHNQWTFDGAWTATGNNQYQWLYSGTYTGLSANTLSAFALRPTLVFSANSQRMTALEITPTFTIGAFTSLNQSIIYSSGILDIDNSGKIVIGSASRTAMMPSNDNGAANVSGNTLRLEGFLVTTTSLSSVLIGTANNSIAINSSASARVLHISPANFAPSSGAYNIAMIYSDVTINQIGGASGHITFAEYNPTITAILGIHYGVIIRPLTFNGFGAGASPSALVHVGAGSATQAQLKLNSTTVLTSPVNGVMEYDGTNLYFTPSATTRRTISYLLNTGAADEIVKSNGTDVVPSGLFAATLGNIVMGSASLAGTERIISVNTSDGGGVADLRLSAKGSTGKLSSVYPLHIQSTDYTDKARLKVIDSSVSSRLFERALGSGNQTFTADATQSIGCYDSTNVPNNSIIILYVTLAFIKSDGSSGVSVLMKSTYRKDNSGTLTKINDKTIDSDGNITGVLTLSTTTSSATIQTTVATVGGSGTFHYATYLDVVLHSY